MEDCSSKIPKKTEIFEGQVVSVEKLVKDEQEMLSHQSKKPNGRTRILKAEIRRDK